MYTFSCVTKSSTRKRFRLPEKDSVTSPLQHFAQLSSRDAHRIGCFAQRIIHISEKFEFSVCVSTMDELVRPSTVLKRLFALFEAIGSEKEKYFVRGSKSQLYTFDFTTTRIRGESFSPAHHLPPHSQYRSKRTS